MILGFAACNKKHFLFWHTCCPPPRRKTTKAWNWPCIQFSMLIINRNESDNTHQIVRTYSHLNMDTTSSLTLDLLNMILFIDGGKSILNLPISIHQCSRHGFIIAYSSVLNTYHLGSITHHSMCSPCWALILAPACRLAC